MQNFVPTNNALHPANPYNNFIPNPTNTPSSSYHHLQPQTVYAVHPTPISIPNPSSTYQRNNRRKRRAVRYPNYNNMMDPLESQEKIEWLEAEVQKLKKEKEDDAASQALSVERSQLDCVKANLERKAEIVAAEEAKLEDSRKQLQKERAEFEAAKALWEATKEAADTEPRKSLPWYRRSLF